MSMAIAHGIQIERRVTWTGLEPRRHAVHVKPFPSQQRTIGSLLMPHLLSIHRLARIMRNTKRRRVIPVMANGDQSAHISLVVRTSRIPIPGLDPCHGRTTPQPVFVSSGHSLDNDIVEGQSSIRMSLYDGLFGGESIFKREVCKMQLVVVPYNPPPKIGRSGDVHTALQGTQPSSTTPSPSHPPFQSRSRPDHFSPLPRVYPRRDACRVARLLRAPRRGG